MPTNTSVDAGLVALNTTWQEGATDFINSTQEGVTMRYVEVIPCDTVKLSFAMIANNPIMEAWYGARVRKSPRVYTFESEMRKYQATLRTKRTTVQYGNNLGIVGRSVSSFFNDQRYAYDRIAHQKWKSASGAGPVGYDGVPLFDANHPHGAAGAVQSNIAAATVMSYSSIVAAEQAGMLLTKENGEPLGITYTDLEVGPKLKRRAMEILGVDRVATINASGVEATSGVVAAATRKNVMEGAYTLTVNVRDTSFHWTLMDLTRPGALPMIMQQNRYPEPIVLDQMNDMPRVENDEYWHMLEGDFEPTAGYWQTCFRGTGAS